MPVVLTDTTNKTWAVEQPNDGLLHVGYTGKPGPRVLDLLDFVSSRPEQFKKFVEKRRQEEMKDAQRRRVRALSAKGDLSVPEDGRSGSPGTA